MSHLDNLQIDLHKEKYIADENLAIALKLSLDLNRPLLLEGEAGVGKTEIAKTLAAILDTSLIRLQCYEGLDAASTIYEWNYQKQLLSIKASEKFSNNIEEIENHIFSHEFLLKRPLLQAISQDKPPVLLIDEVDRADMEFEAFLLEILSEYQVSIPELGTISATSIPHVILTSNGTRELSDALRRRCLYYYVDFPSQDQEIQIILTKMPQIEPKLAAQIVRFVSGLRKENIDKIPGVAETLDWAAALCSLDIRDLQGDLTKIQSSLICLLKTEIDLRSIQPEVTSRLIGKAI